jgi:hypothetical protein
VHEELSSCDEHCGLGWLPSGMRGCFPGGSGSGLLGYTPLLGDGEPGACCGSDGDGTVGHFCCEGAVWGDEP